MLFSKFLVTTSLALLASAATIPGKRATTCQADYSGDKRSLEIQGRQSNPYYCDCGSALNGTTILNSTNADAAVAEMYAALPFSRIPSLEPNSSLIFVVGDVAAFFCNFDSHEWTEFGGDFGYDICEISNHCGSYVGGVYKAFPDDFVYATGYMKYTEGLDVCAASKAFTAQSC